jgi:hypothetical protein
MQSLMKHDFSKIPQVDIPRSSFNRSHGHKTTFDAGYLVPIYVDEALPGDTFNLNMSCFARLATPIVPFMDNMYLDSFFFAVPYRLVWDNFQKFMGEQANPSDSTDYLIPSLDMRGGSFAVGSLYDYLGLPTGISDIPNISSLFCRAYNLIYNEWFRDQNLQDSVLVPKGDGPDDVNDFSLLRRGKRHDYFTSCLPWPQKGPTVPLPLGDQAPVHTSASADAGISLGVYSDSRDGYYNLGASSTYVNIPGVSLADESQRLYASLEDATASTINELREAFQIQRMLEKDARGGTRYIELIKSHFGVTSEDYRLQRPEYLGGGSLPVNVHPIAQTQRTDSGESPLATLAGIGTVSGSSHGFTKSFSEHCIVLGLVNVRADLTYQQGIDKKFLRQTRYDFYWPSLAHLGEQEVTQKEIYATGTDDDDLVFGYQERFAEYRYFPSKITGLFRSSAPQSLDFWHLSQDFESAPLLNSTFIQDDPPVDRVIATPDEPHFIFDSYFNIKTARPMPMYGVPGLIDHF